MSEDGAVRPVVLCILDGWGWRTARDDNAVAQANTPAFDRLWAQAPHCLLSACGQDVGLPEGQMGNSEVGHMNLGAGRVVLQELPKIDDAVARGALAANEHLVAFAQRVRAAGGRAHLLGLMSPGGVHSHQRHMAALAAALTQQGVGVDIHVITDGRDTPPKAGRDYLAAFEDDLAGLPDVRIATVSGRYYAMDRDRRWDRVAKAFNAMAFGQGVRQAATPAAAIDTAYAEATGDEFILPTVIGDYAGMAPGDGVLGANFRSDRMREIMGAFADPDFDGFARTGLPALAGVAGMVDYSDHLKPHMLTPLFPPKELADLLGDVVARSGARQLRIAETEKFPHVTFFFNGGQDRQLAGEERELIPSPKVATYDQQPEMSAPAVTEKVVAGIERGGYALVVLNFANPDMVGHTGDMAAAIQACEAVDTGLDAVARAVERAGGALLVTADHGNADIMRDAETGQPHTAHTMSQVPCLVYNAPGVAALKGGGRLADIAPTLLALMGLAQPAAMTGESLLVPAESGAGG